MEHIEEEIVYSDTCNAQKLLRCAQNARFIVLIVLKKEGSSAATLSLLIIRVKVPLDERGDLDFIMLEPDWLLQICSFEFDVVETKWLIDVGMGDGINGSDCSL